MKSKPLYMSTFSEQEFIYMPNYTSDTTDNKDFKYQETEAKEKEENDEK